MRITESRENLLGSSNNLQSSVRKETDDHFLTPTEKKFLLHADRGDVATVRRLIEEFDGRSEELSINCVDPLNRTALVTAIENENIELVRLLLEKGIRVKDALLHAIKEEYVEGVEIILEWEEDYHVPGQPYSWEAVDRAQSAFTPDITPLILAAHMNNYEILKILLDRGASLPSPHDVRCGCDECLVSSQLDSLRHSQSRINAYRALSASSLIALSSRDPLLTAFELSCELKRLSFCETEFRSEYKEMREATQKFATSLLDHSRTSLELEIMLNFNMDDEDIWDPGERHTLTRLKLAIKYKQKKFVAHPNVQQLLASIWYDGLPGFRRKSMFGQLMEVARMGCMFPFYSFMYMIAPDSKQGVFMKKPFVKFICHSSSYAFFLMLLGLASQRAEFVLMEWFGTEWMQEILRDWKRKERGSFPGVVECCLIIYVISWIHKEVRALWSDGLQEYSKDLWNVVDFISNFFYISWISLRFTSIFIVHREIWSGLDPYYPREKWDQFDPMLISEGAFAAGMIFSFLKLVHIFSVNPHLGPLQISLGRMIIDIIKFFFIFTLVLFAFGCGMNQLLWYYADLEKAKCYILPDPSIPDFDGNEKACSVWRRFSNLFETSQSLFWASFGLVDLVSFDLQGIKSFTRFWALLLFGSFSVINIIVLLNMLIAMMSSSYQIIQDRSDVEWKFARSRLWMSYFDDGDTLPAPFNLMPTIKQFLNCFGCRKRGNDRSESIKMKSKVTAQERHDSAMRMIVKRYIMAEQTKLSDYGISEDDVMEIRQDISTLRYELVDILRNNGMKTPQLTDDGTKVSKKGKVMERRLIKDFQIGIVEGVVTEALKNEKGPQNVFDKIANALRRSSRSTKKKDWNEIVRVSTTRRDPIGRGEGVHGRKSRQSIRRYIIQKNAALESMDPDRLVEYNPKLSEVSPAIRVAYTKFKIPTIKREFQRGRLGSEISGDIEMTVPQKGDDDVFEKISEFELKVSPNTSIVRPRPRSSSKYVKQSARAELATETILTIDQQPESICITTVSEDTTGPDCSELPEEKDFRSRTPIHEDEENDSSTEPNASPHSPSGTPVVSVTNEKTEEMPKTPQKTGGSNELDVDTEKSKSLSASPSRSPVRPSSRAGGRSTVTGQIITGWL